MPSHVQTIPGGNKMLKLGFKDFCLAARLHPDRSLYYASYVSLCSGENKDVLVLTARPTVLPMPSWPSSVFTPRHIIATRLMTSLRPISSLPRFHFLLFFYYFAHRRPCSHLKWSGNEIRRRACNCVACNLENHLSIREWVAKQL